MDTNQMEGFVKEMKELEKIKAKQATSKKQTHTTIESHNITKHTHTPASETEDSTIRPHHLTCVCICLCVDMCVLSLMSPIRSLLRPLHFDVVRLLSLPLELKRDVIFAHAFTTKRRKATKLGGVTCTPAASAIEAIQPEFAPENLSLISLEFMLNHIIGMIDQSKARASDPLVRVKHVPLDLGDGPPLNTAEPMMPMELLHAITPILPDVTKVGRQANPQQEKR